MKKWVVKDLSERVRKLCSMQALLCRELSQMRLLCRDPPRTGIVTHFSASHWKSGKNGSSLTLNSFQARKKVKDAVGARLSVMMRLWIWKKTAGLKGRELGALQDLDTEPLKNYSCLRLDFHCCSHITLIAVASGLHWGWWEANLPLSSSFFQQAQSQQPRHKHKTFLPSPLSIARVFSSLLLHCLDKVEECPCPYLASPNTGTPHPRRDSVLSPFSLGSQPHILAPCHCGLFRCLSTCLPTVSV